MRAHWAGVVIDSTDPQRLARFWAEVLGYVIEEDSPGWVELRNPDGGWPHLTCQGINQHVQHGAAVPQGNKFHLDIGTLPGEQASEERLRQDVARLERLGARRIDKIVAEGQAVHWVWADPEGNVFCAPGPT